MTFTLTQTFKKIVEIDQWGREIYAIKYSSCTILPLAADALFLVDLCKIIVSNPTFSVTTN